MGVLATLVAALFPDYIAGTNAPHSPSMADLRSFAAAIDNAYPNAQDLSGLAQTVTQVAEIRDDQYRQVSGRIDDADVLITKVAEARDRADIALGARIDGVSRRVDHEITARLDAVNAVQIAAKQASDVAVGAKASLADLRLALPLMSRPGDAPDAFTVDLASGISGVTPNAVPVTTALGTVLRVTGALPALATCGLCAIEPNRLYKVRAAFQRAVDTVAPSPAAVRFAVAWYGADRNRLGVSTTVLADVPLTVASGVARYSALLSLNPPDQTNLGNPRVAQPPVGAVYLRPFLQVFGDDVVTDLAVLEHSDVTDAAVALPGPSDMLLARLARVEAALNLPAL